MKYLGIGVQTMATVLLGFVVGYFLDKQLGTQKPTYTIIFSSAAIVIAIYLLIKPFIKK